MTKIKYDKEVEILSLRLSDRKSVDSDVRDNVVVDYDKDGKVVNIEIMNISLEEFKKTDNYLTQFFGRKMAVA